MEKGEITAEEGSSPLARGLQSVLLVTARCARIIPARAGFTGRRGRRRRTCRDHPRSRGVYNLVENRATRPGGSSPLARGLPGRGACTPYRPGIIPARAGFTGRHPHRGSPTPDHPRSRGVYTPASPWSRRATGSSPLARGLRERRDRPVDQDRIIPARAGFTMRFSSLPSPPVDHPRSRGVYQIIAAEISRRLGSSPLARGLPAALAQQVDVGGIIPARAGFTEPVWSRRRGGPDHPRSRGVYRAWPTAGAPSPGSSPLARGLPVYFTRRIVKTGIIPARAGFTPPQGRGRTRAWDHPRSRGVYTGISDGVTRNRGSSPLARGLPGPRAASSSAPSDHPRSRGVYTPASPWSRRATGSSPLARGLRERRDRPVDQDRIIPARAGFTMRFSSLPSPPVDHPRSRGVYQIIAAEISRRLGSSPLARGLPAALAQQVDVGGIIPARAGFTEPVWSRRRGGPDHPRSRGVYPCCCPRPGRAGGSSPLARGLPIWAGPASPSSRIIPARAGFTAVGVRQWEPRRDHPRSRGVYGHAAPRPGTTAGSSPLARGLRSLRPTGGCWPRDHPRSRGVYPRCRCSSLISTGSSPLARGLQTNPDPALHKTRIIPARAGFTGEMWWDASRRLGSSPLARGLRRGRAVRAGGPGIIPARAGFTP